MNKTETDTVAADAMAVAEATAVVDEAAVAAVDTAAVAAVTVVADEAAVAVTVVADEAAVDEAAAAEVTVASVDEAAVAEATVVDEATTVVGDPDSVMVTAAVAMIQDRTTVVREVLPRDTEARHEAKPTNLLRIRRKALATVKPIETTGRPKVASAVAVKETIELKIILPRQS